MMISLKRELGEEKEMGLEILKERVEEIYKQINFNKIYFDISLESIQQFSNEDKEELRLKLKVFRNIKIWMCVIEIFIKI